MIRKHYKKVEQEQIPLDEWLSRCDIIFILIPTEYSLATQAQVNELFTLYNDRLKPRENGKFCSKCRGRVYKRLLNYYQTIKKEQENGTDS